MNTSRSAAIRSALALILSIASFACAPAAAPSPTADDTAAHDAAPAECLTLAYPCALRDVAPATVERSLELGETARERLDDGATTAEAAAWLREQPSVAVVEHDDHGLRFRLDGGRFVWLTDGPIEMTASRTPRARGTFGGIGWSPSRAPLFSRLPTRAGSDAGEPRLNGVVAAGEEQKSAIVLAPLAHLGSGGYGATDIAAVLQDTRGYGGRVTDIEGSTSSSGAAMLGFSQLAGHEFVLVRSFGARVCAQGHGCRAVVVASQMLGDWLRLPQEQQGTVDVLILPGGLQYVALGADYFRTTYPNGLQRAMIFFDVPDLNDDRLTAALKGPSSEYFYWDGNRQASATGAAIRDFVSDLSRTGRASAFVHGERHLELVSDGATFVRVRPGNQRALRIRELLTIRNPITKTELVTGSSMTIEGTLGDGKPDKVGFVIDIDGITEEESTQTLVTVTVDGVEAPAMVPADGGEIIDEFTWRLEGEVEVPDLTEDHELDIHAEALLAEGGKSQREVVVKVGQELGSELVGDFTATSDTIWPGVKMTTTAHVTFVRKPSDPTDTKFTYEPTKGEFTWEIQGNSDKGCRHSAGPLTWPIETDNGDELRFDLTRKAEGIITYWGDGHVGDGPEVDLDIDCPDRDTTTQTRAEGDWFLAPQDVEFLYEGGAITGSWRSSATIATTYSWTITPVE